MKHLADFVQILPLSDFDLFDGSTLISKSGADSDRMVSNNPIVFEINPEVSGAGPFYTEKIRITSEKLSDSIRNKYTSLRAVEVLLFDDDQNPLLWGNLDPNTDYDVIDLVRKTTKALF